MANPNYQLLIDAAKLLKPMLGELVFVGGCTTGLLITDKAAADVRPTFDVDAIAGVTSYVGYTELSEKLKKLGFRKDAREGAPRCRWRQNTTTLDVMPIDGTLLLGAVETGLLCIIRRLEKDKTEVDSEKLMNDFNRVGNLFLRDRE